MANLVQWIMDCANGESIEGVVIGNMGWGEYGSESIAQYNDQPKGKLLSWIDAKPLLDYDFSDGYDAPPGCNAICVWTTNRIITVCQYDGSTCPVWFPRNPIAFMPSMPGG